MENDLNLEPSIMRIAVYGLAAVLLSAAPALAQQSPQTQGAWTPPRSALSSAMPTFSDDTALQSFPTNLVANTFGFQPAALFEIEDPAERAVPVVQF